MDWYIFLRSTADVSLTSLSILWQLLSMARWGASSIGLVARLKRERLRATNAIVKNKGGWGLFGILTIIAIVTERNGIKFQLAQHVN